MDTRNFIEKQLNFIEKVYDLHKEIMDLDESLKNLHPIAMVENNTFYVFDINQPNYNYEFIMKYPTPMPIPEKALASFPLDFYQNKATAIISASELENPDTLVYVYHEFVHCYQWNHCEQKLKSLLSIEKQEQQKNNFAWEINYPFPYTNNFFISSTMELNDSFIENEYELFKQYHIKIKEFINETDYEYMIWQEWKEGYARYVENLIRIKLGMKENSGILSPPFNRVCFYEIGSKYISILFNADNSLCGDLEKLFYKMMC